VDEVSLELRTFIGDHVGSILQLELLLQMAADPARGWDAETASSILYVGPDVAQGLLEGMQTLGLVAPAGSPARFHFAPANPEWGPLVQQLALLYKERRLTVIGLIYSSPDDNLRRFADAFRFRRPS
jgi:hypothetical protein